jgi:hypothetical protein
MFTVLGKTAGLSTVPVYSVSMLSPVASTSSKKYFGILP